MIVLLVTTTVKEPCGTGRGTTMTPRLILSIFCLIMLLFISGDV